MKAMMENIYIPTFTEAAEAISAPCRHLRVDDGSRLGSALTLAERRMR